MATPNWPWDWSGQSFCTFRSVFLSHGLCFIRMAWSMRCFQVLVFCVGTDHTLIWPVYFNDVCICTSCVMLVGWVFQTFFCRGFSGFLISVLQKFFTCFGPDLCHSLSLNLQIIARSPFHPAWWVFLLLTTRCQSCAGLLTNRCLLTYDYSVLHDVSADLTYFRYIWIRGGNLVNLMTHPAAGLSWPSQDVLNLSCLCIWLLFYVDSKSLYIVSAVNVCECTSI